MTPTTARVAGPELFGRALPIWSEPGIVRVVCLVLLSPSLKVF